jgi:putative hemolysin
MDEKKSTLSNAPNHPSGQLSGASFREESLVGAASPHLNTLCLEVGDMQVRLATSDADIEAAQRLRYHIFYEEMQAKADPGTRRLKRDADLLDGFCDHLLVCDMRAPSLEASVVGTYRLVTRAAAERHGRFYTASEYHIEKLIKYPGEILELGRSCVHKDFRNGRTMNLLWRGLATYVFLANIELMFGCASLHGTDVDALRVPLSYLYHYHLAEEPLRTRALEDRYVSMNMIPKDLVDVRDGLSALPPLLKGYLRVGCTVGDGAVVDHQFNTTDVCIIQKTNLVTDKYLRHYQQHYQGSSGEHSLI